VLKAGAAYVPLESGLPPARIRELLRSAEPTVVLTASGRAGEFPSGSPVLVLDDPATVARVAAESPEDLDDGACPVRARNAAYVLFTSGSTGASKGVVVEHRGVINLVEWAATAVGAHRFARMLAAASFSFDM